MSGSLSPNLETSGTEVAEPSAVEVDDQSSVDSSVDSGSSSQSESGSQSASEQSDAESTKSGSTASRSGSQGSGTGSSSSKGTSVSQFNEDSLSNSFDSFKTANVTLTAPEAATPPNSPTPSSSKSKKPVDSKSKSRSVSPKKKVVEKRTRNKTGSSSCSPAVITPGKSFKENVEIPEAKSPNEESIMQPPAVLAKAAAPTKQLPPVHEALSPGEISSPLNPEPGLAADASDNESETTVAKPVASSRHNDKKKATSHKEKSEADGKTSKHRKEKKNKAAVPEEESSSSLTKEQLRAAKKAKKDKILEKERAKKAKANKQKVTGKVQPTSTPRHKSGETKRKAAAAAEPKESTDSSRSESSDDQPGTSATARIPKISDGRRYQRLAMSRAKQLGVIKNGDIQLVEINEALKRIDSAVFKVRPTHAYRQFYRVPGTRLPHVIKRTRIFQERYGALVKAIVKVHLTLAKNQLSAKNQLIGSDKGSDIVPLWQFNSDLDHAVPSSTQVIHPIGQFPRDMSPEFESESDLEPAVKKSKSDKSSKVVHKKHKRTKSESKASQDLRTPKSSAREASRKTKSRHLKSQ